MHVHLQQLTPELKRYFDTAGADVAAAVAARLARMADAVFPPAEPAAPPVRLPLLGRGVGVSARGAEARQPLPLAWPLIRLSTPWSIPSVRASSNAGCERLLQQLSLNTSCEGVEQCRL
jgi:hypothetical protein